MNSFPMVEQEETLFLLDEQPPPNLQKSESFDDDNKNHGLKSLQRILSASASLASTNQPQPYRSLSAHDLTPQLHTNDYGLPPTNPSRRSTTPTTRNNINDIDTFVRQFEIRLREHRLIWQKEYDATVQRLNETKNNEFEALKNRYETKLHTLEDGNKQLEIILEKLNEENQRLKFEIEHQKQQTKTEQITIQEHLKEIQNEMERKVQEIKNFYENEKQDIKRQHSRTYQDLLDETNQRLKKMENDYKSQQSTHDSTINEMERRMVDLRSNLDRLQQMKLKLDEDKISLVKNNEQLQLQIQELTNKLRHADRDHADQIQRYENELKSLRLRNESGVDLLRKENDLTKNKATKTIDELEKQLSTITEKFYDMQKLFEQKLNEQQTSYQNNIHQCENDYEKKIQLLKQEMKQLNDKFHLAIQQNEQLQNELKQKHQEFKQLNETCLQQKDLIEKSEKAFAQIKIDLEKKFHDKIQEINDKARQNELQLIENLNRDHVKVCEKLKLEYEQIKEQNEEKIRTNFNKDIEEIKHKYDQATEKQEQKMKYDLQQIDKLSVDKKLVHENEKQKLINEYEQFIRKIEKQHNQKTDEYEKRIEILISKTHEQLKSIEDEFSERNSKQQSIINDQQKMIQVLKDEQNKTKASYEKQSLALNEQCLREKNEIKAQFDLCMKNLEKNFNTLTLKKEQLERKLSYLNEQHKHELLECRLAYENNLKGLLSNDVRIDLENTIHSLKQQVVYLQQRIAFLQQELEQYIQIYGHRPFAQPLVKTTNQD
ncbi:unnamed protein product [Rotaria sordida]|uniref:Uncharacterized protein n=1 Tax=Rotaria sordida TaxID=392033 RepID=A0A813W274_9BILA|nr:unnamed protein product [Rotaria sordida]CAF0859279.1 unnamed protein product [Rotaria sordida]CAF3618922.1 unnamed protein product [Rotaria sordida]CAF3698041.1 unnamed protein product [Rotaria sordida]